MTPHPYLTAAQFHDDTFLMVRRRVALLMLPHATGRQREQLERLVDIYGDLLNERNVT